MAQISHWTKLSFGARWSSAVDVMMGKILGEIDPDRQACIQI
jgi:hypothetical protein